MKIIFLVFLFLPAILSSQVMQEWVNTYHTTSNIFEDAAGICLDNQGNSYTAAQLNDGFNKNFSTIKYNSSGLIEWIRTFDRGIGDGIVDITKDNLGNIAVTGFSENQTGTYDIITIKYDSSGDSLWINRYNSSYIFSMDQPVAMCSDLSGNIYVEGYTFGGGNNNGFVTIKYSSNGDSLWAAVYSPGAGGIPRDIYTDLSGNVYVCGQLNEGTILKYSPDGNLIWSRNYPVYPGISNNILSGDSEGNIFYGGQKNVASSYDYAVLKITGTGDTIWTRTYNALGGNQLFVDEATSIEVDNSDNIILGGGSHLAGIYLSNVIKFSASGEFRWAATFPCYSIEGSVSDIETDSFGNIYVTGSNGNYVIKKYSSSGDTMWTMQYSGSAKGNSDMCKAMAIDNAGNIYVTGSTSETGTGSNREVTTIKYTQTVTNINNINIQNLSPAEFTLYQNYPNPFNPATSIRFEIGVERIDNPFYILSIYNAAGKEIATLINANLSSGSYEIKFDASQYPSGVYFYRLESDYYRVTKRMILLK